MVNFQSSSKAVYLYLESRITNSNGLLLNGLLKKRLPDSFLKQMINSGITKNILLSKDLRKVSSSSGVKNVIILGALITVLLNSILPSKRIKMVFFQKMRFMLELLHINWIARTVQGMLILVNFNLKVTTNLVMNILAKSISTKLVSLLVILFSNFQAISDPMTKVENNSDDQEKCRSNIKQAYVERVNLVTVFGKRNLINFNPELSEVDEIKNDLN